MRVLFLTVGSAGSASTRVRALEPAAELRGRGIDVQVVPSRRRVEVLMALRRRWDVVVLQKVVPDRRSLELIRSRGDRLVFECDDAIGLGYPGEAVRAVERRRDRLPHLLDACDGVTTTNPLLAVDLAPRSGAVLVLAGPAPGLLPSVEPRGSLALWVGSPSTSQNLSMLADALPILTDAGWRVDAVGADPRHVEDLPGVRVLPWSPGVERASLAAAAVGVMPLSRSPWNDRKAAYKVLTYLASGVVPVVSESPAARCVVREDEAVFVPDHGDWAQAVLTASSDRREKLAAGRGALERLTLRRWVDRWLEFVAGL